eukprot:scaffold26018_cov152-Cylindrotheca_fusiformis.AAC.2
MKFQSAPLSIFLSMFVAASRTTMTNAQPGDRPFGGGPHGERAGFPGFFELEHVNKTCDAAFACDIRGARGHHAGGEKASGIFVCRETYHPITGDSQVRAKCIASDKAFETDDCGCCGEDCPEELDFQSITCENQENITISSDGGGGGRPSKGEDHNGPPRYLVGGREGGRRDGGGPEGGRGGSSGGRGNPKDAVVVCRELYNPYTGVLTPVTIPIRPDHSLAGDTCGCCNNECPGGGVRSEFFKRPDQVELDWCATDDIVNCTLPGRRGHGPNDDEEEEQQGVFVCRSMTNMLTGDQESQPLCIPTDRAWETDDCGCCDGLDCPIRPEPVEIECAAEIDQCERRNGKDNGVFVCRDLYHPLDGSIVQKTLCIDSERAWATDDCGCCPSDEGCPVTPESGFASEDEQIMELTTTMSSKVEVNESSASVITSVGNLILIVTASALTAVSL